MLTCADLRLPRNNFQLRVACTPLSHYGALCVCILVLSLLSATGAACFRCSDPVWKSEMARFTGEVVQRIKPLLLPNGGPVIMLQIENEYRGTDLPYLKWAVSMARNTTTAVRLPRGGLPIPGHACVECLDSSYLCTSKNSPLSESVLPYPSDARAPLSLSLYLSSPHAPPRTLARTLHTHQRYRGYFVTI